SDDQYVVDSGALRSRSHRSGRAASINPTTIKAMWSPTPLIAMKAICTGYLRQHYRTAIPLELFSDERGTHGASLAARGPGDRARSGLSREERHVLGDHGRG